MKKTYSEIIKILSENCDNISSFVYDDYDYKLLEDCLGSWKQIHISGGSDKGSDWSRVYHFEDHDVYIKFDAYYTSYTGIEFDDLSWEGGYIREVRPKEVIKIIYE